MSERVENIITPDEITAYASAASESLRMLNDVMNQQMQNITAIVTKMAEDTMKLSKAEGPTEKEVSEELKKKLTVASKETENKTVKNKQLPTHDNNNDINVFQNQIAESVNMAVMNTVYAQQQMNVTAQAAITLSISKMFSNIK